MKVGDHVRIRDDGPGFTLELTGVITMLTDLEITIGEGFTMERETCTIEYRPFLHGAPVPHGSHAVCDRVREAQGRRIGILTRERDEARDRAGRYRERAYAVEGENRRLKIMTDQMREGLGFWRDRQRRIGERLAAAANPGNGGVIRKLTVDLDRALADACLWRARAARMGDPDA